MLDCKIGWLHRVSLSVVFALAFSAQPAFSDSDAIHLPVSRGVQCVQDTEMLPLPVELKAKENHARPPMSHRRRSHERPVGDVLPNSLQLQNTAPVGTASAHVSAELPAAVPAAAPAVASPAAIDTNSLKPVQNTPNNAPKSVKIYSRPAAPAVSSSSGSMFDPQNVQLGDMQTAWGYGPRENKYNADILKASQQHWPHQRVPLHPLLFKSLVANESAFNPTAVSYTGATGLTQLTPDTMRRFGLNWSMSRDPQYAVPAGVKVLAEKARVVLEPQNYCKITGMNPSRCSYAQTVAEAYQKLGEPTPEQSWYLVLGAYNAGGGTILRAMARAYKQGKDPRDWDVLVGDANNKAASPLFQACQEIFPNSASAKYKEISEYPGKILKLYRRNQPVAI